MILFILVDEVKGSLKYMMKNKVKFAKVHCPFCKFPITVVEHRESRPVRMCLACRRYFIESLNINKTYNGFLNN